MLKQITSMFYKLGLKYLYVIGFVLVEVADTGVGYVFARVGADYVFARVKSVNQKHSFRQKIQLQS